MGRNLKPLAMQTGNLTVEQQEKKKEAEKLVTTSKEFLSSNKYPKSLTDSLAKKEYRRVKRLLQEIDLIGDLDVNNLVGYCNAFSGYHATTMLLKEEEYSLVKDTKYGPVKYINPLVLVQKNYAEEMRKFAALCGMTVDSRLKAATTKVDQEDREINGRFGAI